MLFENFHFFYFTLFFHFFFLSTVRIESIFDFNILISQIIFPPYSPFIFPGTFLLRLQKCLLLRVLQGFLSDSTK